jgi:DNA-3-methyladenine glycosylase
MKLERSFYTRDTITVAKELLGCYLIHKTSDGITKGQIVEVEAYKGPEDKGSHSYNLGILPQWTLCIKLGGLHTFFKSMATIIVLT